GGYLPQITETQPGANPTALTDAGIIPLVYMGGVGPMVGPTLYYASGSFVANVALAINAAGNLVLTRGAGAPLGGASGDLLMFVINASDQMLVGG
ncbi:MAG: hypothetical protein ACREQT_01395, partial [Candidatus Binataceae bacterium]